MSIAVVGAGWGRTGTMSLKLALEHLGLGPTYHMTEVFTHPDHRDFWVEAASGARMDYTKVFARYGSVTDWPACNFYREIADFYPDSKVILTMRDANAWFDSTQKTIFQFDAESGPNLDEKMMHFFQSVLGKSGIGPRLHDRAYCVALYEKHVAVVEETIPKDRLLLFDVAQGWGPLCRFLNKPVPATPFPRTNTSEEFQDKIAGMVKEQMHKHP